MHQLVAHPDLSPASIDQVGVQVATTDDRRDLWLEYSVRPAAALSLPERAEPVRADDLWKTTCFELFVRPEGSSRYLEFNFSPSTQWAAYEFEANRAGRRDFPSHDPEIWTSCPGDYFFLQVEALPNLPAEPLRIGFSAIIEETDGTKSYWALKHPPGPPDFHHPDCFVLELPPAA